MFDMLRIFFLTSIIIAGVAGVDVDIDDTKNEVGSASFHADGALNFDINTISGGKRKVKKSKRLPPVEDDKGDDSKIPLVVPIEFSTNEGGDGDGDGGGVFRAEPLSQTETDFVLPPGRIIAFPSDVKIRSMALAVNQGGLLVIDGAIHGDRRALTPATQVSLLQRFQKTLFGTLFPGKPLPYPSTYLISSRGAMLRNMEFPDAGALPLGGAESPSGRIAVTFYQGSPGIEVWEASLSTKNTFHDVGVKPALALFDTDELLWVPFTIADRLNEEGSQAAVLFAYRIDGSRWEGFARRQLSGVKFPHALHLESNLLVVAGLREWAFQDGIYGPELKAGLEKGASYTALDFYALTRDEDAPSYTSEQFARYAEREKLKLPLSIPHQHLARKILLTTALEIRATYDFPFPLCLWPLFALMGDGHAITACYGQSDIRIIRYADLSTEYPETPTVKTLAEKNAPPIPNGFLSLRLRKEGNSRLVGNFSAPWDVSSIVSIQADPSGKAFIVADSQIGVVFSVPWPMVGFEVGAVEPMKPLTQVHALPGEKKYTIHTIPRSS